MVAFRLSRLVALGLIVGAAAGGMREGADGNRLQRATSGLANVQPMTLLRAGDGSTSGVMRDDTSGSTQTAQLASGCPDLWAAVGDHVFVRTDGMVTDLVLVRQHQTCAVDSLHADAG